MPVDNSRPNAAPAANESVALAETDALHAEAAEEAAHARFDALRSKLTAQGRAHEATRHPEFSTWMEARITTDEAWGRWALAMHAATPLA